MRANAGRCPVFSALLLAACSTAPATQVLDLIVHDAVPSRVDFTTARFTSVLLPAQNLCAAPRVLLDGVPYPEPWVASAAGVRLPGGQHLIDGFRRAHPASDGCGLDTTVRLTIDCSGQTPSLGVPDSIAHAEYGIASDFADLRLTLSERASVTAFPGGDDVSPYFPVPFVVGGWVDEATAFIDGKPVPVTFHLNEAGPMLVQLEPGERLAPGPHVATMPGGAAGVRLADRRCLPDEGASVTFTVRGAEQPDLRAWVETSPERRLRWEDLGRYVTYQVFLPQADGREPMILSAVGGLPEIALPEGIGACFRVQAIVGRDLVATSPTVCEER